MRTTCVCCQGMLNISLKKRVLREMKEDCTIWTVPILIKTQADCRLCNQRCCASCLTLDEVCTTCRETLETAGD